MDKEIQNLQKQNSENEVNLSKECANFEKIAYIYVKYFKESVTKKGENDLQHRIYVKI
jgi:hypothetical protein